MVMLAHVLLAPAGGLAPHPGQAAVLFLQVAPVPHLPNGPANDPGEVLQRTTDLVPLPLCKITHTAIISMFQRAL